MQKQELPRMARMARIALSEETPAQPCPQHRRSTARSNILAPFPPASASECQCLQQVAGCACRREGCQDVGRRPPVLGTWLRRFRVGSGFHLCHSWLLFKSAIGSTEFLISMNNAAAARALRKLALIIRVSDTNAELAEDLKRAQKNASISASSAIPPRSPR
jgi:hypothetical protein